jgi:SAM-dependent methyltransferase
MTVERDFYETTYHFEDDVVGPGEARLWRAMRLLEPLQGSTFLDLGSGVGWAAHLARKEGGAAAAVGIDFAWRALRLGQESIPNVWRIQGDGCHLPLADRSVQRAFSFGSVEHFPDVAEGLRELARVLTDDGRAVVVVPNFYVRTEQPRELRQSLRGWRRSFEAAGLETLKTTADFGPRVLRDRRPARVALRAGAKTLSLIPGLQYQFIFLLTPRRSCPDR